MPRSTRIRTARTRRHAFRPRLDALEPRRLLSTFQVIHTDDSGPGSLRQALLDTTASPDADTITFAIPANDPNHVYYKDDGIAGRVTNDGAHVVPTTATDDSLIPDIDPDWSHSWWTIRALSGLVVDSAVTIEGYSQSGSRRNTLRDGDDAVLRIELDGRDATPAGGYSIAAGLYITADDGVVQGLVINRFGYAGITMSGTDVVQGCFIGTDVAGTIALPNAHVGVEDSRGYTRLGTDGDGFDDTGGGLDDYAERNLVSGNGIMGCPPGRVSSC